MVQTKLLWSRMKCSKTMYYFTQNNFSLQLPYQFLYLSLVFLLRRNTARYAVKQDYVVSMQVRYAVKQDYVVPMQVRYALKQDYVVSMQVRYAVKQD